MKYDAIDKKYAPVKGSEHAAGFDLSACINLSRDNSTDFYAKQTAITVLGNGIIQVNKGRRALIMSGIRTAIDNGYYGRIAPRSGLALKNGIVILAGVIDSDYRGPVGVAILNTSDEDFIISDGDRIAQLIIERIYTGTFEEVASVADILPTLRGEGGFGSTGVSEKLNDASEK